MSDDITQSHLPESQRRYSREVVFNAGPEDKIFPPQPHYAKTNVLRTLTFRTAFTRFWFDQVRLSNIYFLLIAILDQTEARDNGRYLTLIPLTFILGVNAIIESVRYINKRKRDTWINNRTDMTLVEFDKKKFSPGIKSQKELKVGDVLVFQRGAGKINRRKTIAPADLVIISTKCSDHDNRTCGRSYIEPSNLTGELKKKVRQAPKRTEEKYTPHRLDFMGKISFEEPNDDLFQFNGELKIKKNGGNYGDPVPLNDMNFVPRGTRITNATTVVAVVVYIGKDTKIGQNMKKEAVLKRSISDVNIDAYVFRMMILVLFLSNVCGMAGFFSHQPSSDQIYSDKSPPLFSKFPVFIWILQFHNIIPISLLISIELIRIVLMYFIKQDRMFDQDFASPRRIANTRLVDQLGCLTHIIFDKTGTCTTNELTVKYLACNGSITNLDKDRRHLKNELQNKESKDWKEMDMLFTMMAICNGITGKQEEDGHLYYNAESRDELALVESATKMGYKLTMKTLDEAFLEKPDGSSSHFKILQTMPFTHESRKMAIIVQNGDQMPFFLLKGAKDAVLELLNTEDGILDLSMNDFSAKGFRTLFFAWGTFSIEEANNLRNDTTSPSFTHLTMTDRMMSLYQKHVPATLHFNGASGIQDVLRDDVIETIGKFKEAGLRLWMATGDNLDAAKFYAKESGMMINNTGQSILRNEPKFIAINKSISKDTMIELQKIELDTSVDNLLMSGKSLDHILNYSEESKSYFRDVLKRTKCAIFAELKPSQKQSIIELISDQPQGIHKILPIWPRARNRCIMAVGDGGNDLPMLEASDIGIDINKTIKSTNKRLTRLLSDVTIANTKETPEDALMNDARSVADFSVGDWKSLQRLILVHGTLNFTRIRKFILYFFYKNVVFHMIGLWFSVHSQFNGTDINSDLEGFGYNIIFTCGMSFALGIFEKLYDEKTLMKNPKLYRNPQLGIKRHRFLMFWISMGMLHSMIIFVFSCYTFDDGAIVASGHIGGVRLLGSICYLLVIVIVNLKVILIDNWKISLSSNSGVVPRFTMSLVLWMAAAYSITICLVKMLVASVDLPYLIFSSLTVNSNYSVSDLTNDMILCAYFPFYFLLTIVVVLLPDYTRKVYGLVKWEKEKRPTLFNVSETTNTL